MKKIGFFLIFVILGLSLFSCNEVKEEIKISEEDTSYINNPDQGFYNPIYIRVLDDKDLAYQINDSKRLYHLRMDISAYSSKYNQNSDLLFSDKALENIDHMLNDFLVKEKSVIIRFAYDHNFEGKKDQEPSLDIMISHIKQLAPILNKYEDLITAIEAGLIGPWGEMHSSSVANKEIINQIIDTYLKNINNIPILVRTPIMIYNYLGITIKDIDTFKIDSNSLAYRLGIFNDGYLGSDTDLGTYTSRNLETTWLSYQTNHLPYGGEVTIPSSKLHDIDNCLPEMNLMHLSYLNELWNDQVIKKWKNEIYQGSDKAFYGKSAYEYINAHLGYRFLLNKVEMNYNKKNININLEILNKGFGNLNRNKKIEVYILYEDGTLEKEEIAYKADLSNLSFTIKNKNEKAKIYLSIKNKNDTYPIKLANKDIFDESLNANLICKINN